MGFAICERSGSGSFRQSMMRHPSGEIALVTSTKLNLYVIIHEAACENPRTGWRGDNGEGSISASTRLIFQGCLGRNRIKGGSKLGRWRRCRRLGWNSGFRLETINFGRHSRIISKVGNSDASCLCSTRRRLRRYCGPAIGGRDAGKCHACIGWQVCFAPVRAYGQKRCLYRSHGELAAASEDAAIGVGRGSRRWRRGRVTDAW